MASGIPWHGGCPGKVMLLDQPDSSFQLQQLPKLNLDDFCICSHPWVRPPCSAQGQLPIASFAFSIELRITVPTAYLTFPVRCLFHLFNFTKTQTKPSYRSSPLSLAHSRLFHFPDSLKLRAQ